MTFLADLHLPTTGIIVTLIVVLTLLEMFRAWNKERFRFLMRGLTICLIPLVSLFCLLVVKQILIMIDLIG